MYQNRQPFGLQKKYANDADFALTMWMLHALAFVPVTAVTTAVNTLCDSGTFPDDE